LTLVNLLRGLICAVLVLALLLGIAFGRNNRTTDLEALAAKRAAHASAAKSARRAASKDSYNSGLAKGMITGAKKGRIAGEAVAAENAALVTAATGATGATGSTGATGPTGR
jgi:hypothetical protein